MAYILGIFGVIGLVLACFGLSVVIDYYVINFILWVFNVGYEISWLQAVGVTLVLAMLKNIFSGNSKGE